MIHPILTSFMINGLLNYLWSYGIKMGEDVETPVTEKAVLLGKIWGTI